MRGLECAHLLQRRQRQSEIGGGFGIIAFAQRRQEIQRTGGAYARAHHEAWHEAQQLGDVERRLGLGCDLVDAGLQAHPAQQQQLPVRLVFDPIDFALLQVLGRQLQPPPVVVERTDGRERLFAGLARAVELLLAGKHVDRPRAVEETDHAVDALPALLEHALARQQLVVGDLREVGDGLVQRVQRLVIFRGPDVQADLFLQGGYILPLRAALLLLLLDGGVDEALVQIGRVGRGVLRRAADPAHRAGDLGTPQQLIRRPAARVPAPR